MSNSNLLARMYQELKEQDHLKSVAALLQWDQSVMMPSEAAGGRSEQRAFIAGLLHQRLNDPAFLEVVETLAERITELSPDDAVNVSELKRTLDRARKLPKEFVSRKTELASTTYSVWEKARPADDFRAILPHLEQLLKLAREEAELVGYDEDPYDALLDIYEPGARISETLPLLRRLGDSIRELLPRIQERQGELPPAKGADIRRQEQLCREVAKAVGFSFRSGRLDKTAHPFADNIGPNDFRITTRYQEDDYLSGLYSTLHEAGHALYEMGLLPKHRSTPLGEAISLGIHESQSLLWEDVVGRSKAFLSFLQTVLDKHLPAEERYSDPESIWRRINHVAPSLIRVDADEVTYSLHIVIRTELELALLKGELLPKDLPGVWRERYKALLGVEPLSDRDGVLQDVHWYFGAIGYFPTYALGKLYAAMFYREILIALPELEQDIRRGNFTPLLTWLRENIHQEGRRYRSAELVRKLCNKDPDEKAFISYVKEKFLS